jgi:UDP-GlcNAc:undecaprenyl-phosphate GlcNAc-1-phosphate transferase
MPLLGGFAVALAVALALGVAGREALFAHAVPLAAAFALAAVGLVDDRTALGAGTKLAAQLAAAAAVLATGPRIHLHIAEPANLALTLLWIVGVTNAFNLLDNMDGLAAGVAATVAGGALALALLHGQHALAALAAAVLGAALGFGIHNRNPASIFLGDCGSLLFGFLLALIGIALEFPALPITSSWIVPLLLFAVPLFDTSLVTLSRLRRGLNPLTTPGRDHLSHRLARRGLGARRAVARIVATSAAAAAMAVAAALGGSAMRIGTGVVGALLFVAGLVYWERRGSSDDLPVALPEAER